MSVEGGELYLSTAYLDGQKVTNEDEVLLRISTYSGLERRMLTVASSFVGSESQANVAECLSCIKKQCSIGYKGECNTEGEYRLKKIPRFEFDPWKVCSDAAGGLKLTWSQAFGRGEGEGRKEEGVVRRGEWIQSELHVRTDQRNAENLLREDMRPVHQLLVREWLLSKTEEEWKAGFERLQDWYDRVLVESATVKAKMRNWSSFWQFRCKCMD
jgi:hypothetical protein